LSALFDEDRSEDRLRDEHGWAIEIVRQHFAAGLEEICDKKFLARRYSEFQKRSDPIYIDLLNGMEDEALAKTFVSYWMIGQTMATQSRFWLEDAIAQIITYQALHKNRPVTHVFSHAMLGQGILKDFRERPTIAELGETAWEHTSDRSPWRALVQQAALREIDILIGEQEREPVPERKPFAVREWSSEMNLKAIAKDKVHLARIVGALTGPPPIETPLQCNLLVIEPDRFDAKPHAWGIRFINPKSISSHSTRKQERVNLLRLYALLVQEKIMRQPESICVCLAELVPRKRQREMLDYYPDYFSAETFWSSESLWKFIGVPFGVVSLAIRDEAKAFRDKLKDGLRTLLPKTIEQEVDPLFER